MGNGKTGALEQTHKQKHALFDCFYGKPPKQPPQVEARHWFIAVDGRL
jgi:hypothetical protein